MLELSSFLPSHINYLKHLKHESYSILSLHSVTTSSHKLNIVPPWLMRTIVRVCDAWAALQGTAWNSNPRVIPETWPIQLEMAMAMFSCGCQHCSQTLSPQCHPGAGWSFFRHRKDISGPNILQEKHPMANLNGTSSYLFQRAKSPAPNGTITGQSSPDTSRP